MGFYAIKEPYGARMRSFPITPKNLKRITAAVFCLVLTLAAVFVASWFYPFGFHDTDDAETMTTYAMGSIVQQTVYGAQAEAAESAASSAITALENRISWRVEGSEISKLNQAAGKTDWKWLRDSKAANRPAPDNSETRREKSA